MNRIFAAENLLETNERLQNELHQVRQQLALAQQSLQASEARFRNVIEKNADGVLVVDREGIVHFVNTAAEALLKRRADELLGQMLGFPVVAGDTTELDIVRHGESLITEMRVVESEWEGQPVYLASLRDITQHKRTENALADALHVKELLLQEIHHRIKNNLTIVSGLLSLQMDLVEDGQVRAIFKDSQNRIVSMARIHEHLYRSDDLTRIDMAEYVQELVNHLQASFGAADVDITIIVDNIALDIKNAIPCGLIINELMTNALKYAFTNGQKKPRQISIKFYSESKKKLILIVGDNGGGLSPDFDWRNTTSLGLKLVKMLAQQFHGQIELNSTETGTSFKITFPYPIAGPSKTTT